MPRLRDCPRLLDTSGMIFAAIPTPFSYPRRRRSAVRRWPGRSMRLSLLPVGADAYDRRPKFQNEIWSAEAMP